MADLVYPPVIAAMYGAFRLLGLRLDVQGSEHIPRTGGAVLASNHVSYADFIFCGLAAQPAKRLVRFMAKDATFRHPVSGPLMRSMHHIPVDRAAGASAFRAAVAALQAGEVVGVFPEATVSLSFEIKQLKSGAARMAADSGTPLVPMVTFGAQRLVPKGERMRFAHGAAVSMRVGEALQVKPDADFDAVTDELRTRLQDLLEQVLAEYPDRDLGVGQPWWPARLGGTAPTPEEAAKLETRLPPSSRGSATTA